MATNTTVSVPPIARPALSTGLKALFRMLSRGAAREGAIELRQHGGTGYHGGAHVPVHDALPEAVIGILEHSASPWGVGLAVRQSTGGPLASVSALAVRRDFPMVYENPSTPESPHGRSWVFPVAEVTSWQASLEAWTLPPTMVIHTLPAVWAVWAVWALSEPLPARSAEDQATALRVLQGLAQAVEAELPGALADVEVPLVGTRVRNQDPRVVTCVRLDESRGYAVSAIEAAMRRK